MERAPRRGDDEQREEALSPHTRVGWVAQVLGETWETDGDGIYRRSEASASELPSPADKIEGALLDHDPATSKRWERWETGGDGIYRRTDPSPSEVPSPPEQIEDALGPSRGVAQDGVDDGLAMPERSKSLRRQQ